MSTSNFQENIKQYANTKSQPLFKKNVESILPSPLISLFSLLLSLTLIFSNLCSHISLLSSLIPRLSSFSLHSSRISPSSSLLSYLSCLFSHLSSPISYILSPWSVDSLELISMGHREINPWAIQPTARTPHHARMG